MKHVFQKCLTLLTIIFIFGLYSCEKDLYEEDAANKIDFKMRRITFDELQKIPNAFNKIRSIKDKQNRLQNGRIIYDSINDFTIDTDKIVLAEKDGIIWLTFGIKRNYETNETENLVLKSETDGTYLPFLFKYDLTEADKNTIYNGNAVDGIASKTSVQPLELHLDDVVVNTNERTTICVKVTFTYCSFENADHPEGQTGAGANCPGHAIGEEYICGDFDNIGDGDGGDDGWTGNENIPNEPENSGGGGGSATPTPTPIITVPLLELEDDVDGPTDETCIKMNLLKNDVGFKQKLQDLKTAADNNYFETTIIIADNNSNTPTNNYNYESTNGNPNIPQAPYLFYPGISKGLLHNHYSGLLSIFTVEDLAGIYDIVKNPNVMADELTFALVTKAGTVYALTINDKNQFIAFGNKNLSNEYQKQYLISDLIKNYNVIETNSNDTNEKGFQKMMKDYNMGINLFRGDNVNFNSWTKIQRVKGRFEEINCN